MQVTHIERTVPFPIGKDQSILSTAAVDFAPVNLKDTIFWLPVAVTAFTTETRRERPTFYGTLRQLPPVRRYLNNRSRWTVGQRLGR
jgi:hypothetical protein